MVPSEIGRARASLGVRESVGLMAPTHTLPSLPHTGMCNDTAPRYFLTTISSAPLTAAFTPTQTIQTICGVGGASPWRVWSSERV